MNKLQTKIEKLVSETRFSGVVAVDPGDGTTYHAEFGYRNRAEQLPNTADTRFGIASGTKLFTALGIGCLCAQGKLDPGTRVADIDERFVGFIHAEATVLELLTHTSGMYDYLDEELIEDYDNFEVSIPWYKLATPLDYLPLFQGQTPKFNPGERYSYSNGGYVLLGCIIEIISGELYRDFIRREVLEPAGMGGSGFFAFNELPGNTATGYLGDGMISNVFRIPIRGGGDGGMYTTTRDLHSFWKAFTTYHILPEGLTEFFLREQVQFNEQSGYGCGLYRHTHNSNVIYSIVGGDAGVGFYSQYSPESGYGISILSNVSDGEEEMQELLTSMDT